MSEAADVPDASTSADVEGKAIAEIEGALAQASRDATPELWFDLQNALFQVRAKRIDRINGENRKVLEELVGRKP